MQLLDICKTALRETGEYAVPATIVSNTDPTAVRLLALANRAGHCIGYDYRWQVLLETHTFPTVSGTSGYDLPADFNRISNKTIWDRTNDVAIFGPVSPREWNRLQYSSVQVGSPLHTYFRMAGNQILLGPTPDSVRTIGFDYWSKYWIDGDKETFTADTDEPLIDSDLLILGLRWRYLQAVGDDYEPVRMEYMQRLDALQSKDGGRDYINFGQHRQFDPYDNLPDTGFGV